MSLRGYTYAVRNALREKFPLEPVQCDVMRDGRPPFYRGQQFVSVWSSQWSPGPTNEMEQGISEALGFTATITYLIGIAPDDKLAQEFIYKACTGIEQWARRIMFILTKYRWEIMCAANEIAKEEACGCDPIAPIDLIHTPARWSGNDPSPRLVGPDWVSADLESFGETGEAPFAMVMDVRFSDGIRTTALQNIGE